MFEKFQVFIWRFDYCKCRLKFKWQHGAEPAKGMFATTKPNITQEILQILIFTSPVYVSAEEICSEILFMTLAH